MDIGTALVFIATVLPLVCTPGPDMLFVLSQALSGGTAASLRATVGICLGYLGHAVLAGLGIAAVIAASPLLFEVLRWFGVLYLLWLSFQLLRSALRHGGIDATARQTGHEIRRGFLTAFLNPKGVMISFAILPQFIDRTAPVAPQAVALSLAFVGLCAAVYTVLGVAAGLVGRRGGFSHQRRRIVEGTAGGLLILAAARLAAN